jgi:hypothetical protein
VKIKVIRGKINNDGPGAVLDVSEAEAERLIGLGFAEKKEEKAAGKKEGGKQ